MAALLSFVEGKGMLIESLFGTHIDLIPPLMIYVAMKGNLYSTLGFATWAGLLFDVSSANPLGTSLLSLSLVGILWIQIRGFILHNAILAQMILGATTAMLNPMLQIGLLWGMGLKPLIGWETILQLEVMGLFGAFVCPVFFKIFGWIESQLNFSEEASFRSEVQIKRGKG